MVPEDSMPGDIICQFWNVEAAAVLRPHGNGSYRYNSRAAIVGNAEEWDKPTDINSFNSTRVPALPMSLTELIHLSFGAVNLTVPPDTYSIFRSCTLWLVKWDSRRNEQQDRGHILSKHIAGLSEEQGERNGYLGMGYFRSTSCIEHATPQCFFFFKIWHAYYRFCYLFFERGWGNRHHLF